MTGVKKCAAITDELSRRSVIQRRFFAEIGMFVRSRNYCSIQMMELPVSYSFCSQSLFAGSISH